MVCDSNKNLFGIFQSTFFRQSRFSASVLYSARNQIDVYIKQMSWEKQTKNKSLSAHELEKLVKPTTRKPPLFFSSYVWALRNEKFSYTSNIRALISDSIKYTNITPIIILLVSSMSCYCAYRGNVIFCRWTTPQTMDVVYVHHGGCV